MILSRALGVLSLGLAIGNASQDQNPASLGDRAKVYEVVSIKPSAPAADSASSENLPNGFRDINTTLDILVKDAYSEINDDQVIPIREVVGMPSWARSEHYDVEARVDPDTTDAWKSLSMKQRLKQEQPLLRAMLSDRCKLKAHLETKEMPVYDLVIAKGGLKMKEATADEKYSGHFTNGEIIVHAMPIEDLVFALPSDDRLIVNKTGLAGRRFDFDLKWAPEKRVETGDSGPSIFTALEEQLGLKLVSSKAPGKLLVIDHMEKPSPN